MEENPFELMYKMLVETRLEDTRPFKDKTILVIHPSLRTWIRQFPAQTKWSTIPDGIVQSIGMPVYEYERWIDETGQVAPVPMDRAMFVHEDHLWRFKLADWAVMMSIREKPLLDTGWWASFKRNVRFRWAMLKLKIGRKKQ